MAVVEEGLEIQIPEKARSVNNNSSVGYYHANKKRNIGNKRTASISTVELKEKIDEELKNDALVAVNSLNI